MAENTAVKEEIERHVRALRRYALVLTRDGDEAEDIVQETIARALTHARLFKPGGNLRVWLFTILHNVQVSRARRRRTAFVVAKQAPVLGASPAPQPLHTELRQTMEALARLPVEQRLPVVLVGLESLSYAEAAKVLKIPVGTLMSRLHRGRQALRRMMEGEEPETSSSSLAKRVRP